MPDKWLCVVRQRDSFPEADKSPLLSNVDKGNPMSAGLFPNLNLSLPDLLRHNQSKRGCKLWLVKYTVISFYIILYSLLTKDFPSKIQVAEYATCLWITYFKLQSFLFCFLPYSVVWCCKVIMVSIRWCTDPWHKCLFSMKCRKNIYMCRKSVLLLC